MRAAQAPTPAECASASTATAEWVQFAYKPLANPALGGMLRGRTKKEGLYICLYSMNLSIYDINYNMYVCTYGSPLICKAVTGWRAGRLWGVHNRMKTCPSTSQGHDCLTRINFQLSRVTVMGSIYSLICKSTSAS